MQQGNQLPLCVLRLCHLFFLMVLVVAPVSVFAEGEDGDGGAEKTAEDTAEEKSGDGEASTDGESTGPDLIEWAAREKAAGLSRAHLDPDASQQSGLFKELSEREKVWLDSPADEGKFLGVALKEAAAEPKGAVIIVPDYGQHARWPVFVKPLADTLPDKGWFSFAVSVPTRDFEKSPERSLEAKRIDQIEIAPPIEEESDSEPATTDGGEDKPPDEEGEGEPGESEENQEEVVSEMENQPDPNDPDAGGDELPDEGVAIDLGDGVTEEEKSDDESSFSVPVVEVAQGRLAASLAHVKSMGYDNIVLVGYRGGAQHVLNYAENNKSALSGRGFGIVLVDPTFEEDNFTVFERSLEERSQVPFLDMVNSQDRESFSEAKSRKRAAKTLAMSNYRQIKMALGQDFLMDSSSGFAQRIASWITVNVEGKRRGRFGRR